MIAAVLLSLAALIVAIAGVRLAQRRIGELERRLETALAESAQRAEAARSEALGDIEALFESYRATVNADMAGKLGNALQELTAPAVARREGQPDSRPIDD